VWIEAKFIDPQELHLAYERIAIGIGGNLQVLPMSDYWAKSSVRFVPVWDDTLQSLQVGLMPRPEPRAEAMIELRG
jgi:hypothetical protein